MGVFHEAITEQNYDLIERLLNIDVDVNEGDEEGNTPLMLAVRREDYYRGLDHIHRMLELGADLNARNKAGETALMVALDHGALLNVPPLMEQYSRSGEQAHIDPNYQQGRLALLLAVYNDDTTTLQSLLDAGADVNARNKAGETPLMMAAELGHAPIVCLLLERGADVYSILEVNGWTALHIASDRGHAECALALLEAGAEVDDRDHHLWTPLIYAAFASSAATVRVLLEHGANIHAEDDRGSSALAEAGWLADEETIRILLDWGAGKNLKHLQDAFLCCFIDNNRDKAPLFLQAGAQVGLHEAILLGGMWTWIVPTLLAQGADVNARKSKWELTPLMLAVKSDDLSIAEMLLEHKANPNVRDKQGRTALILAARKGSLEMVKLLLGYGADPNLSSLEGATALLEALDEPAMIKVLLAKGVGVNAANKGGDTA